MKWVGSFGFMKVYILYEIGGEYDGTYSRVIGVYSSNELAHKEQLRVENFYSEALKCPEPCPSDPETNDEFLLWQKWWDTKSNAEEFRRCDIEKVDIDKAAIDILSES